MVAAHFYSTIIQHRNFFELILLLLGTNKNSTVGGTLFCAIIQQYEPVSRDQIPRRERGQGTNNFLCSADHEQDWQPYPVDLYS